MLSRIKNRLIGCGLPALIHDELTARTHQNLNFWGGGGFVKHPDIRESKRNAVQRRRLNFKCTFDCPI
jgi:hypothetical protein